MIQVGQITYHLSMKRVGDRTNSLMLMAGVYAAGALTLCAISFGLQKPTGLGTVRPGLVLALAGAVSLIELGFVQLYRAGGGVASSPLTALGVGACLLALVGAVIEHEEFTASNLVGIPIVLAGIFLVTR